MYILFLRHFLEAKVTRQVINADQMSFPTFLVPFSDPSDIISSFLLFISILYYSRMTE
jgi:hypothetical protein